MTNKSIGALHDNQEFFPSGILSSFGINEGIEEDTRGEEQIEKETYDETTYDVPDPSTKIELETKLRYAWIFIFYIIFPLGDLISDAIVTGNVSQFLTFLLLEIEIYCM